MAKKDKVLFYFTFFFLSMLFMIISAGTRHYKELKTIEELQIKIEEIQQTQNTIFIDSLKYKKQ